MSLIQLSNQLKNLPKDQSNVLSAVESWNPPYCGEIDMTIKSNGDWFYNGSMIKRLSLVKLFASVLMKEAGSSQPDYFLITPVEKVKITVEDAPFMLTQWRWLDAAETIMQVSTNLGDEYILNEAHPLTISESGDLYVRMQRNLLAKVHRNVYYQWVALAHEQQVGNGKSLVFHSDGCEFTLGVL